MKVDPIVYLNINGTVFIIPRTGQLFSIEDFKKINAEYSVFEYDQTSLNTLTDIVDRTFLKDFDKPFMLMADSFGIPQFLTLKFDPKTVDCFNQQGLHIFLNEPLVKYTGPRREVDRTNISAEFLKNFEFSDIRFEMTTYARETLKSFQLDCINDLAVLNGLTQVSVYTPDYGAGDFYSTTYPNLKLRCQDLFLAEYISIIDALPDSEPTLITHKFVCSNWRYAHHRHLIMSYLVHYSGKYSWYYKGSFDQLNNGLWFDLSTWDKEVLSQIRQGLLMLNNTVPLNVDFDITEAVNIEGQLSDWFLLPSYDVKPYNTNLKLYSNVFCAVVNECDFTDPTANISEKTLLPIKYKKPFILAGQPGSLEYAKKLGFKTFSDFWDESYDLEINHEHRFLKIFQTIDYINSLNFEQLEDLYVQMLPVIEHNYKNLKMLASSKSWPLF